MVNPLVSVIIPNYNHADFLYQRLESVFNQTYRDFEVILLDDCSIDKSIEIIKPYLNFPRVSHYIVNKKNSGSPFKQWLKGITLARGEFIWIAESDDYCDNGFLEDAVAKLQKSSNAGLVYCQSWGIDREGNIIKNWINHTDDIDEVKFKDDFVINGNDFITKFLIKKNVIPNASAVVFKKGIYDYVGGINQNIKNCGDWFLWLKIAMVSDIVFISKSLNYFRYHNNSVIYKALHTTSNRIVYPGMYDKTMRIQYYKWCKQQKINDPEINLINRKYILDELFSQAQWYKEKKRKYLAMYITVKYYLLNYKFIGLKTLLIRTHKKLIERIS